MSRAFPCVAHASTVHLKSFYPKAKPKGKSTNLQLQVRQLLGSSTWTAYTSAMLKDEASVLQTRHASKGQNPKEKAMSMAGAEINLVVSGRPFTRRTAASFPLT